MVEETATGRLRIWYVLLYSASFCYTLYIYSDVDFCVAYSIID